MTPVTRSRLIILTVAAGGLLFFLHILGALSDAEAWIMRKLSPQETKMAETARSMRQVVSAPFHISAILNENAALKTERDGLLVRVAELKSIEDENAQLRDLLKFSKRAKKPPVMAHVLATTPESGTHAILIDVGSDDGILPDMPVVAGDGIVIGKIFKLNRTTSTALLLTDTRSRIGAAIDNAGRTQGIVQGKRGLSLEMQLIPQNEALAPGDVVVTSGIEPLMPSGLVIGNVQDVQTQEKNPFKTATIASPVSYDQIDVVAIPQP